MNRLNRIILTLAAAAALWLLPVPAATAQTQDKAEVALKAAMDKEIVDGDLKAAIEQYNKILAQKSTPRPVAARALYQLGQCQEKLGQTEARKAYERLVKDYGDQAEMVARARVRLAAMGSPGASAGVRTRQVWTGPKVDTTGTVSPDGRYLSYADWDTGDLALHDLVAGADRRLTNKGTWFDSYEFAEESVISPDGKQVAYSWFNKADRYDLRLVSVTGNSPAAPRVLYDNEDIQWIGPYGWSPDGKWIAVRIAPKDRTEQIGLVSVGDGSLRVLKSIASSGSSRLFFSPDGRHLALDLPSEENPAKRDVFVLPVEGNREMIPAVVHPANDEVMGWSPDGSRLLFSSDRTGAVGLWGIPVSNGTPQGSAELIKAEIGAVSSLGLTASGALYFGSRIGGVNVQVASIDFATGQWLSPPVNPIPDYLGANFLPDWSPDGKFLSYVSRRGTSVRNQVIVIRSLQTGQARELRPQLRNFQRPRWSPDGRSFAAQGFDLKGRQGIFRIDAQNGEASPIVVPPLGGYFSVPEWGRDGRRIYYRRPQTESNAFVERDLVSGAEREIIRRKYLGPVNLSPDGRWIVTVSGDESAQATTLIVIPVVGGEPREMLRVKEPESVAFSSWAPDADSIIVRKQLSVGSAGGDFEHWQVPLSGGEPRKLNLNLGNASPLRVHPDGRQVAYSSGNDVWEVWVLENFLPAAKSTK